MNKYRIVACEEKPVSPGCSAMCVFSPLSPFQPEELIIEPDIAKHFVVENLRVGNQTQMLGLQPIPATFFTPRKADRDILTPLTWDFVCCGLQMAIDVRNISETPQIFIAIIYGKKH